MKIGILTHYYKSGNYGGNLQAWALCTAIKSLGYDAEQIAYHNKPTGNVNKLQRMTVMFKTKIKQFRFLANRNIAKRKSFIKEFNQSVIPHSKDVYTKSTIENCKKNYDVFVTGSDQVWHPQAVCDAYLLKFADSDKVKLSYAASVAHDELTEAEKNRYKSAFADYKAISVREENAIELLQDLSPVKIQWVLDPTLLISKEEWLEIATDYRIEDKYLFCFFLGDDVRQRELSKEYAEKKGLKIVTLPHLNGYKKCDKLFGDYQLYDVDPRRLISIVNNAECIFTDSFHMTVFSLILQKQHFVFQRSGAKSMSSRIYSLISMFDTASHFCDDDSKVTYEYIDGVEKIDYSVKFEKYEKMKARSIEFLKNNIAIKE